MIFNKTTAVALLPALLALAACQPAHKPGPGPVSLGSSTTALATMERIALSANACWFKSQDAAFRPYRLAPELNSFSGRPRILVVPARNPGGRPLLVVHAEGQPAKVEAFGPLMQQTTGARIAVDVQRWASGQKGC